MTNMLISSPHAHDHSSITRIMSHVCLALTPCTLYGFYLYGYPAINLFVITVVSCVAMEALCLHLLSKPLSQLKDNSAVLTGWLLALTLPPWGPWWLGVCGAFLAIIVGKQIFGGIGQNIFNPAMLARVALLISFPVQMTTWPLPGLGFNSMGFLDGLAITFGIIPIPDGATGATALSVLKTELSAGHSAQHVINEYFSVAQSTVGNTTGSMGETSALLILLGGLWLLIARIISWHIPIGMICSCGALALVFNWYQPEQYAGPSFHLLSGAMMLGAFFIATDLVTSPSSKMGKLVFGAGCGAIIFVIRSWGSFPEAMGFAVLFMNALTPLIDLYFKPRIYGRTFRGAPKTYPHAANIVEIQQRLGERKEG